MIRTSMPLHKITSCMPSTRKAAIRCGSSPTTAPTSTRWSVRRRCTMERCMLALSAEYCTRSMRRPASSSGRSRPRAACGMVRPMVDGTLYFGDQAGNVYALDAATGQNKKWSVKVEGGVKMTPLVTTASCTSAPISNRMYALRADTGQSVWAAALQGARRRKPDGHAERLQHDAGCVAQSGGGNSHTTVRIEQEHRPGIVAVSRQTTELGTVRNRV